MRRFIGIGLLVCWIPMAWAMTTVGPVKAGDNLWRIAQHNKIKGVSNERLIAAIKQLNPAAFDDKGNLNIGVSLQVPTTVDELTKAVPNTPAALINNTTTAVSAQAQTPVSSPVQTEINTATPATQAAAAETAATGGFPWAWIWFVLFVLAVALYLRSRQLVIQYRRTHNIVAQRLGGKRPEHQAAAEVTRYDTLGLKRNVRSQPQTGEGRIIADVMIDMAEERYELAEKKLLNAIRENKRSLELRMKLLEVYVLMNNQNAFNKQAEYLLKHMVNESDDVWAKVRSMYLKKWVYDE